MPKGGGAGRERGTVLALALAVAAAVSLLAIALLMAGETERRIAKNEHHAAEARYAAEAVARIVQDWFDRPGGGAGLEPPPERIVDRTLREIDEDGDPATPPRPQDGDRWPRYKQGVDRDADGRDDLFDRPWSGDLRDALLGTPGGPDLRIDAADPAAGRWLEDLSLRLFGAAPLASPGRDLRILRVDVHGPPAVRTAAGWARRGIATVRVTVAVREADGRGGRLSARRTALAVVDRVPYDRGVLGPLRACGVLRWSGQLGGRWGTVADGRGFVPDGNHGDLPAGWPRALPVAPGLDLAWGWDDGAAFVAYRRELEVRREALEDPWFRYLSGGPLDGAPPGTQPWPFTWDPDAGLPPRDGEWPNHDHPGEDATHANLFQTVPGTRCDGSDYGFWKALATSGRRHHRYFAWAGGDRFRESGRGEPRTFREIVHDSEGLMFFDTADARPPRDDDGDGLPDNLTPSIRLEGGAFAGRGLVHLNAAGLYLSDLAGRPAEFRPPGEPYRDENRNGRWDPGEDWVNLAYPADTGGRFVVDAGDNLQDDGSFFGPPVRNAHGRPLAGDVAFWGVLHVAGTFETAGEVRILGAVLARDVVGEPGGVVWHDAAIRGGAWPPPGWALPRTMAILRDDRPGP